MCVCVFGVCHLTKGKTRISILFSGWVGREREEIRVEYRKRRLDIERKLRIGKKVRKDGGGVKIKERERHAF